MNVLLGVLLIVLGIVVWGLAGLLPVLHLSRAESGEAKVGLTLTWMGAISLQRRIIASVQGAEAAADPGNPSRARIELLTPAGRVPLQERYTHSAVSAAKLAQVVDRFARKTYIPGAQLPLTSRLNLMLRFTLLFPLGTVSVFAGLLTLLR